MRKNTIFYVPLMVLVIIMSSCTRQDLQPFQAQPAVNFVKVENLHSLTYSFMANPSNEYIQEVPVYIIGDSSSVDRSFDVMVVNDTSTTARPDQYEIIGGVVKAGEFSGKLYIRLLKSPALDTSTVTLKLKLVDSDDFKAGNLESSQFTVSWTNKVVIPAWTFFRFFFTSVPSTAAYRLIVQTTGLTTLTAKQYTQEIGVAGVQAMATTFGDYVKQWNKDHPNNKLKHDDGTKAGEEIVPLYYTRSKYD
ncbi:MAG TPA: DUF4843 domain-containing protein [Chitinophagaceae bacterium]